MPELEKGLYTSGREDSWKAIKTEAPDVKISFDKPTGREAQKWFEIINRRQTERNEVEDSYEYARIEIETDRLAIVGVTGDWHLGAKIEEELLARDVHIMAEHPHVVGNFFMGDLTDSANFNPAEDESYLNFEEQRKAMLSIFDYIGKDRILAMWKGNHDHKWERKNGISKYAGLSERYEAPVFYGNSYVDFFVNVVNYKLMGSHKLRGTSIYSNPHPATRGHRETQGLDLTFCGHTHKKGLTSQPIREFNGARMGHGIVTGTYQLGSEYTKDSGYGTQQGDELGMYWIVFGHENKVITVLTTEELLQLNI